MNVRASEPLSGGRRFTALPPLALYLHLPWCVRKCPYCDFNSHEARGEIPEGAYVEALLDDLTDELPFVWGREIVSIFIGGGTPSLFSPRALERLLSGLRALTAFRPDIELTLEANPGTVDSARFRDYRALGVNRLSIGVQSFDDRALAALGRIHSGDEARRAIDAARAAGFDAINLDLMHSLPGQSTREALADIATALDFAPEHLSCYELTLEPNTPFAHRPPANLPDDDARWASGRRIAERLATAGLRRYEVSAWARPGRESVHNTNYWRYGDYLGIGAGAHGKLSAADSGTIVRRHKTRHPKRYLAAATRAERLGGESTVALEDSALEFMMNALRLVAGFPIPLFERHTGISPAPWEGAIARAIEDGLLERDGLDLRASGRGLDCLDEILQRFLPGSEETAASDASRRYRRIPLKVVDPD